MASINTRARADGSTAYRVVFRLEGSRSPTTETFDTAREAAAFSALVDRIGGTAARAQREALGADGGPTLMKVLEDYVAQAPDLTAGTVAEYRRVLDRSGIKDRLGPLPVDLISRQDVERWVQARMLQVSAKTKRPVSPKTLRNEVGLLSTLLAHAVQRRWAPGNVAAGVRLPKRVVQELLIPTADDLGKVIEHISPAYRPLVLLLAATGMRWGEATALTWADVDQAAATIAVRRAWKHGAGGARTLGTPKTRRSYRTIATTPEIIAALGRPGRQGDLVFVNTRGEAVKHNTFHSSHWVPACAAAKLDPRPRIHDLRHFAASHMIASGADLLEVSRALGHESITTTSDIYGHLVPSRARPTVAHAQSLAGIIPAAGATGRPAPIPLRRRAS